MVKCFEDLHCWQEARKLVKLVYQECRQGPISRDFGMRDQVCRAAISAMNNIAEGFGRSSNKEFARFLEISSSSAMEVRSIAYAALDLSYFSAETAERIQAKAEDVKSLDLGLIR